MVAPTNDFLPIATDGGANVITQVAYAAAAFRGPGFSSGVAQSDQLNKVWRQSSFVAAALAQFMADTLQADVLDDGVIANFQGQLQEALTEFIQAGSRIKLTGNTIFYVATTGNDSTGDGTSGLPWRTLQNAWDVLALSYDIGNFIATIQVEDGTYNGGLLAEGKLIGQFGPQNIVIQGNTVTPANCIISTTTVACLQFLFGAVVTVQGFTLVNTSTGGGMSVWYGSSVLFGRMNFGAMTGAYSHISVQFGSFLQAVATYTISGVAAAHITAVSSTIVISGLTVTITSTPAFSGAFIQATGISYMNLIGNVFVGGATGVRYLVTQASVVDTNSAGATYLPGNSAGSVATGGQYI